jgi:hypothetical protein
MSLLTQLSLNIAVYGDTAKENNRFSAKISDRTLDQFSLESSHRVNLAIAASDVAVGFQSVANGQLIVLKSDKAFTVKINGTSNPAITLKPRTNGVDNVVTPAFLIMLSDAITSLHLGNPGAEAIQVDTGIAGI